MAIANRRRSARRKVRVLATLEPGHLQTVAEDVGVGGVFLRTSRVRPPGEAVELKLSLPTGEAGGRGVVRWARRIPVSLRRDVRGGMGILLTDQSAELRAFLAPLPE